MDMHYAFILGFLFVFVLIVSAFAEDVLGVTKSNPGIDVKNPGSVEKEKHSEIEKKLSLVVKDDKVVGNEGGSQNGSDASMDGLEKETDDAVEKKKSDGKTQRNESEQKEKKKIVEDPKEGLEMDGGT